jgi:hypothetical protein
MLWDKCRANQVNVGALRRTFAAGEYANISPAARANPKRAKNENHPGVLLPQRTNCPGRRPVIGDSALGGAGQRKYGACNLRINCQWFF